VEMGNFLAGPFCGTTLAYFGADVIKIETPGGNTEKLTLQASSHGPRVHLEQNFGPKGLDATVMRENVLCFDDTEVGKSITKVLTLVNTSKYPVPYYINTLGTGVFLFENCTHGTIPPLLSVPIIVKFAPSRVDNFYRRFFVFVKNSKAHIIECLGTAYDEERRPAPLYLDQVDAFRRRQEEGLGGLSQSDLVTMYERHGRGDDATHQHLFRDAPIKDTTCGGTESLSCNADCNEKELAIFMEFFKPQYGVGTEVILSDSELDFGACGIGRVEQRTFRVVNNSNAKVVCDWVLPHNSPWSIVPASADIGSKKKQEFTIRINPKRSDMYYQLEAEAYIYLKTNRNFRLADNRVLNAPWCLVLNAFANTFHQNEQFVPSVNFSTNKDGSYEFPPCLVGTYVHRVLKLTNESDTPAKFAFKNDPRGVFEVMPRKGLIDGSSFVLVVIRFSAPKAETYNFSLQCALNNSDIHTIQCWGCGYVPDAIMDNNATLYFKPTFTGLASYSKMKVRNLSRIPIVFNWNIEEKNRDLISVIPESGSLRGNETATVEWTFKPKAVENYIFNPSLLLSGIGTNESIIEVQRRRLHLIGEGARGAMEFQNTDVHMSTTLVDVQAKCTINLVNNSECKLIYTLVAEFLPDDSDVTIVGAGNAMDTATMQESFSQCIKFSAQTMTIDARVKKPIVISLTPAYPGDYKYRIHCLVKDSNETEEREACSCVLSAHAAYPTLRIDDARCSTSSRSQLWRNFSIRSVNEELATPLSVDQRKLNTLTGIGETKKQADALYKDFICNFTPQQIGTVPQVVHLRFKNCSKLPMSFELKLPTDEEVEMESWADAGEPTEVEMEYENILDSHIFQISPRKGNLEPNEHMAITFKYQYSSLDYHGVHRVPMVLKLHDGKQIRLWLTGRTLEENSSFLYIDGAAHRSIEAVSLGDPVPPTQRILLHNLGDVSVKYMIDPQDLEKLKKENFDCDILTPFQTEGFVPANESVPIDFIFRPLQAKRYKMPLNFLYSAAHLGDTSNEATCSVNLMGDGFHPESAEKALAVTTNAGDRSENVSITTHGNLTPPLVSLMDFSDDLVSCSPLMVDFGNIPKGAVSYRLVVIKNSIPEGGLPGLKDCTQLEFTWQDVATVFADRSVRIQPRSGRIKQGQSVVCKVTLLTNETERPCYINSDLRLHVTTVKNVKKRSSKRRMSTSSRRRASRMTSRGTASRQSNAGSLGFTAPTPSLSRGTMKSGIETPISFDTGSRMGSRMGMRGQEDLHSNFSGSVGAGRTFGVSRQEQIMATQEVHLNIKAAIRDSESFDNIYGNKIRSVFYHPPTIGRRLGALRGRLSPTSKQLGSSHNLDPELQDLLPNEEEKLGLTAAVLNKLLTDVIHDPSIVNTYQKLDTKQVPFFKQITSSIETTGSVLPGNMPVIQVLDEGKTETKSKSTYESKMDEGNEKEEEKDADQLEEERAEERARAREERRASMLAIDEYREYVARIMENTVFNIMRESAAGEVDLWNERLVYRKE